MIDDESVFGAFELGNDDFSDDGPISIEGVAKFVVAGSGPLDVAFADITENIAAVGGQGARGKAIGVGPAQKERLGGISGSQDGLSANGDGCPWVNIAIGLSDKIPIMDRAGFDVVGFYGHPVETHQVGPVAEAGADLNNTVRRIFGDCCDCGGCRDRVAVAIAEAPGCISLVAVALDPEKAIARTTVPIGYVGKIAWVDCGEMFGIVDHESVMHDL